MIIRSKDKVQVISAKLKVWRICLGCVRERRCMRIWCMCEESKSVKQ